jgi:hypothetical protein
MFRPSRRLRSETSLRIVVIGNYMGGPITAEPCRAKARPLHPRRSYFAPATIQTSKIDYQRFAKLWPQAFV